MPTVLDIAANLEHVREQIARSAGRAGRDAASIRLIAVTKTFSAETVRAAYECGLRDFGENRVQEFAEKRLHLHLPDARFHLIGHLQSNKVAQALPFTWIHTVDSERLARRLDEAAAAAGKSMAALIQVKLDSDPARSGVDPSDIDAMVSFLASLGHLKLAGLMCLPPYTDDPEGARPYFRKMRDLRDRLRTSGHTQVEELSMGMSHDYQAAIEEGATMVRIGTALFGPRTAAPKDAG